MHERKHQMTESPLYLKPLQLIKPEQARTLGIEADEPVFVSPYAPKQGSCEHCGKPYSPPRYAPGEVTQAQHLHDREGGIYLYYGRDPQLVIDVTHDTGFAGLVEPLSEVLDYQEQAAAGIGRTSAVLVTAVYAVCSVTNPPHKREQLEEGRLIPKQMLHGSRADMRAGQSTGVLVPICYSNVHPALAESAVYHFQVEEGRLTYQPSELWRS
jgi:hypothetical protein